MGESVVAHWKVISLISLVLLGHMVCKILMVFIVSDMQMYEGSPYLRRVTFAAPASRWVPFLAHFVITIVSSQPVSKSMHLYPVLVFQLSKLAFKLKSEATLVGFFWGCELVFWVCRHGAKLRTRSAKLITPVPQGSVTRIHLELD